MLKRWLRKLSQDAGQRRADVIRDWASDVPGTTPIANVAPRAEACIAGVVETIRLRPMEGVPAIEATVSDGSGAVRAVWLGRRALPGLNLGARVILRGRFGGSSGELQLMNPTYEFAAPPEVH